MIQSDFPREFSATASAGGNAVELPGRRGAQRFMTILRVGKLATEARQELCLIRNISAGGLMAHVYAPHKVGDKVEIELKSDQRLSGEVAWVKQGHIGVRFDGAVEISDILTHRPALGGRKSRPPRLDVHGRARIRLDDAYHWVDVRDLSQGGVKIRVEEPLTVGEDVVIVIDGMAPAKAVVRWSHDGFAGLSFIRPIPFDEMVRWLEERGAEGREGA